MFKVVDIQRNQKAFRKRLPPLGLKVEKKSDWILLVIPEYKIIATLIGKIKNMAPVQKKKYKEHPQSIKQNVKVRGIRD